MPLCRACGRSGRLTKEDIQPVWQRRLVVQWLQESSSNLSAPLPPRHVIRICGACNATMGAKLEVPASQILPEYFFARTPSIQREHVRLMATWSAKTMLLAAMNSHRQGLWGYTECQEALRPIVMEGQPPENLHVRVGLLDRTTEKRGLHGILPIAAMPRYEFYSLSVDIELVWEVLLSPHPSLQDFQAWSDSNEGWFTRIWPAPAGDVAWPANRLSRAQLDQHRAALLANRNVIEPLAPPVRRQFNVPLGATTTSD